MRASRATRRADRISSGVILTAGALCGVFVFFVALPLAQSSPFPVLKQQEWVRQEKSYQLASVSATQVVVGVRGDREAGVKLQPRVMVASMGPVAVSLPARAAAVEEHDPDITGSIPSEVVPAVTPKVVPVKLTPPPLTPPKITPKAAPAKPRDLMEEVDRYLWEVYRREPVKKDSTGDFTWKDPAAAKHMRKSLKAYVIGGMDPDFREQLYHAGHAMDAAGLPWSMLSAFRDDYRQQIATGFKARTGNSLHGGSRATGGYGHGRAIDVTSVHGKADSAVWRWLDKNGAKYGLIRPMPGADPAHIQPRGDWRKIAVALRRVRTGATEVAAAPAHKAKVAEQRTHRRHGRGGRG
jgi:hypothetical protein